MTEIVVPKDLLRTVGLVDAFNHRIVVQLVGKDQAVRNELGDRRDAGLVCDISRGEHQRRLLRVQVRKLPLQIVSCLPKARRASNKRYMTEFLMATGQLRTLRRRAKALFIAAIWAMKAPGFD